MTALLAIRDAARLSGLSAKMIRHYEGIGLILEPQRTQARYRQYSARDVHEMGFIRRARDLGFSIEDIRHLLGLWRDRSRGSAEVKAIALNTIAALDEKAASLAAMSRSLKRLAATCHGDERPDCPILDALEGAPGDG
ncbi:MAG: Cu(I)-responsive transcriptional regulator [Acidocella sp.]|nr:Cu(I)-responsive transcriptional regulator [Acidocella sp.]